MATTPDSLDQQIMNLIQDANRKMRLMRPPPFVKAGSPFPNKDLTMSQMQTLWFIQKHGPISMSKLAELLQITPASLSEHVSALIKAKLIDRKHDETDRRTLIVSLSDFGTNLYKKIMEHRDSSFATILNVLSDQDKKDLIRLLAKINSAIN